MKTAIAGDSPQDADSLREVLRDSLEELDNIKREVERVSLVGSRIAAGIYNQGIREQRRLVCVSPAAKHIKSTLEVLKPSLSHFFGYDDSRFDKAKAWRRRSSCQASSPTAPRLPTSAPPIPRRGGTEGRSHTSNPRSRTTSPGPREKAPALPPGRRRASRRSNS
jgi:hypothetical protein